MSRDLRGALHDWAEHERRAADERTPDTTAVSTGLTRRVARRRAVRTGSTITAALVLVGGVAVGVRALDREPVQPAGPTPTVTTPVPTPTPTPTAPAVTSTSVLDALPLPDGIFATTDASWQLVEYRVRDEDGTELVAPSGLYLVAPGGPVYAVPTPDGIGSVLDWLPGTATVVASSTASSHVVVHDLLSEAESVLGPGVLTAVFAGDGSTDVWVTDTSAPGTFSRLRADGTTVATIAASAVEPAFSISWYPSPDRALMIDVSETSPRAVSLSTTREVALGLPYPGAACAHRGWVDDEHVLVECAPAGEGTPIDPSADEWWVVPVGLADEAAHQVSVADPTALAGAWQVGGRLVVGAFRDDTVGAQWWQVTGSTPELLSSTEDNLIEVVAVRGGELVVNEVAVSSSEDATWRLLALDPATGDTRDLLTGVLAPGGTGASVFPLTLQAAPSSTYGDF